MRILGPCALAIATFACAAYGMTETGADSVDPIDAYAPLGLYQLDPGRSAVTFDVAYFWHSRLTMRFNRMHARLVGGEDSLATARVIVTIDAASLQASIPLAARLVEGDAMLDAVHYPTIRFVSTRFFRTGATTGVLIGNLTIRARTRPVTLAVKFDQATRDAPAGGPRTLGFSAEGHFSRAAFGLSRWSSAVGDDVHMGIQAEFVRERANP